MTASWQPLPERRVWTATADRAGLRRTTLHRDPILLAVIEEHRHRTAASGTLAVLTDEIATLRTVLDALATRVRRHEKTTPTPDSPEGLTTSTANSRKPNH